MSWLSQAAKAVGKAVSDIGREAGRAAKKLAPIAPFIPGVNIAAGVAAGVAGAAGALTRRPQPGRPMSLQFAQPFNAPAPILQTIPAGAPPHVPPGGGLQLAGGIVGPLGAVARGAGGAVLGGIATEIFNRFSPGAAPTQAGTNGCGCRSSGRDSCTGQAMTSARAPQATLFGGCCPPGRTLRRQPWARDICIKTPRMNVFNPSALARADRRVTGFARRAAPILKDMGFTVSSTRKVSIAKKRRKRR